MKLANNSRSRKADVEIKFVIGGLIGVFIIAMIFLSPFGEYIVEKLPRILPFYNETAHPVNLPEIVRYNIAEDKAQYYDGVNWLDFPSDWNQKVKIGNKEFTHSQARWNFANYYYKRNVPIQLTLPAEKRTTIVNNQHVRQFGEKFSIVRFDIADKGSAYVQAFASGKTIYLEITPDGKILELSKLENKVVGKINDFNSNPKFSINAAFPEYQYSNTAENLAKINGLSFPFKSSQFDITSKDLGQVLKDLGADKEIQLNGYVLKPTTLISPRLSTAKYQFYLDDIALDIYLSFYISSSATFKKELQSAVLTNVASYSETALGEPEKEIISLVSEWRDSIFSTPMCFCYTTSNCESVEVEKLSANNLVYLASDLKNSQGACTQ